MLKTYLSAHPNIQNDHSSSAIITLFRFKTGQSICILIYIFIHQMTSQHLTLIIINLPYTSGQTRAQYFDPISWYTLLFTLCLVCHLQVKLQTGDLIKVRVSDLSDPRYSSDPWGHSKKSENTKFHLNFTLNSLFSEIYSLESEHFHSLFLESRYPWINWLELVTRFQLQKSESSTDNDPHLVISIIKCKMKYISLSLHSFESAQ